MLHIEWTMSNRQELKEFREILAQYIKSDFGNSFQFTESHLLLALDLGQIYSYRDTKKALRFFEHIKTTFCLHGYISNIEFTM